MTSPARHGGALDRGAGRSTRILLVLAILVLAGLSITDAAANVLVRTAPVQAHAIAPWNGVVASKAAQAAFAANPDSSPVSRPALLARRALLSDATATDALNVLGFQAQLRGDTAAANRIFAYSLKLSRRDLPARLWAIEDGVRRGDIDGILTNYDIALRTSAEASRVLYPVLTSALAEPRIRGKLHTMLAKKPSWTESFVDYIPRHTSRPEVVAQFFSEGQKYGLPVSASDEALVVTSMANQGKFDEAWAYYRKSHPGTDRDTSRDENFKKVTAEPSVFDWNSVNADRLAVSFGAGEGGADFSAPSSVGGLVMHQIQMLPPGTYRLDGVSEGVDQRDISRPYFTVVCRAGSELVRVPVSNSPDRPRRFQGQFTVPQKCPVQDLAFFLRPSDNIAGVEGRILRVGARPVAKK